MDVELRHLRVFAAVARNGSYTAGSKELHITQPAVTRTVQQLEEYLGVQLIRRTSRSFELTEVGQQFLESTERILNDLDRAVGMTRGQRELRVGFQWQLPEPWAGDTIDAFEERTGASVTLLRRDDLGAAVVTGDVEIAVTRTKLDAAGVVHRALFDDDRVAAVSTRSPLADRQSIDWAELADHPVVVNHVNGTTQSSLWPAGHRPRTIIPCGNWDEWLQIVATGRGVGSVPKSAARPGLHPHVAYVPLVGAPRARVWLALQERRRTALVRAFFVAAFEVRDRLNL